MKRAALALGLVLMGCQHHTACNPLTVPPPVIDAYLLSCGQNNASVKPLSRVRTTAELARYANRLEASRERLESDLKACNNKRAILLDMLGN